MVVGGNVPVVTRRSAPEDQQTTIRKPRSANKDQQAEAQQTKISSKLTPMDLGSARMGREQNMLERLRGTGNSQAGKERDVVQENAT